MQSNIFKLYDEFLQKNNFKPDPEQLILVAEYDILIKNIHKYQQTKAKLFNKFIKKTLNIQTNIPKGLYLYGGVGRGKTAITKLFLSVLNTEKALFIHFHEFVKHIHEELHKIRQTDSEHDFVGLLAEQINEKYDILCLDELHISDVSDAMLLSRLFTKLHYLGTVCIFTSNKSPANLYTHDFGKEHFLKFVEFINIYMKILELQSGHDYRMHKIKDLHDVYIIDDQASFDEVIAELFPDEVFSPKTIDVMGRRLHLKSASQHILYTSFEELCKNNLSQNDYIEISKNFNIVVMYDIPVMNEEMHNEAKRFTNLIDQLYLKNVILICTAMAKPEDLYKKGKNSLEFARTASRLVEMQSKYYISKNVFADAFK